jgi:hypothetical protein
VRLDPDRRRWTAEIAVPWSSLGFAAPNPGSTLSANFCRNRWTERRDPKGWADLVSWSPTFAGLTDSTRFGRLELGN